MSDTVDDLVARADHMRERNDHAGALRVLQRVLGREPDHAYGHAALAHCLLMLGRLPAARSEARTALSLDPDEAMGHFAMAAIALELRETSLAEEHVHRLRALEPDEPSTHQLAATLAVMRNDLGGALQAQREAVRLRPYDAESIAALGELHRLRGEAEHAAQCCAEALAADSRCCDARLLRGHLDLDGGDPKSAASHARFVVARYPDDADALKLLAAAKASRNPLTGMWWRSGAALGTMSDRQLMTTMLVMFVVIQVVAILAEELGYAFVATVVKRIWLALCAYTWVAPSLFRRLVDKEVERYGRATTKP